MAKKDKNQEQPLKSGDIVTHKLSGETLIVMWIMPENYEIAMCHRYILEGNYGRYEQFACGIGELVKKI